MMILATALPVARANDGRIIVELPSGLDRLEISLSINQALQLQQALRMTVADALDTSRDPDNCGEVISMEKRRKKAKRSKR